MLPMKILDILERYYKIQEVSPSKTLTRSQITNMVGELIRAYDSLDISDRRDVLVPAKADFVEDHAIKANMLSTGRYRYEINYKWPPNNGFQDSFKRATLYPGEEYDRIGGPTGLYMSPLGADGMPESYLARALPYYLPESDITKSPAYHRYKVISQYKGTGPNITESVLRGIIAHAFWNNPLDGGGTQVKLPVNIKKLGAILNEE